MMNGQLESKSFSLTLSLMASIGRLLQKSGLILPVLAIILQLERMIEVKHMLLLLVMSVATFYLGRIIEGYSQPQ